MKSEKSAAFLSYLGILGLLIATVLTGSVNAVPLFVKFFQKIFKNIS